MAQSSSSLSNVEIRVGDTFGTLGELEAGLEEFKKSSYVEYWKRHCRTIAAARNVDLNKFRMQYIVDENVDIGLVQKYFTEDAWKIVGDVIECKLKKCPGSTTPVSTTYTLNNPSPVMDTCCGFTSAVCP